MNAGARAAQGATLLFLHADTVLPSLRTQAVIREALADLGVVGWRFDVRFDSERPIFRIIAALMNLRSRLSGISTGDQALFVRRRTFEDPGGYPGIPLMEDVAFIRRLKRRGRLASLQTRVITSARKWEREGVPRTILLLVADGSAGQNGWPSYAPPAQVVRRRCRTRTEATGARPRGRPNPSVPDAGMPARSCVSDRPRWNPEIGGLPLQPLQGVASRFGPLWESISHRTAVASAARPALPTSSASRPPRTSPGSRRSTSRAPVEPYPPRLIAAPPRFRMTPAGPPPARLPSPLIQPIVLQGRIRMPPSVRTSGIGFATSREKCAGPT
jgi:hypothetical protein